MKKYVYLYMHPLKQNGINSISDPTTSFASQTNDEIQNWMSWFSTLGTKLVDMGMPFSNVCKILQVPEITTDGGQNVNITGYSIIEAENMQEALKMAEGCPVLLNGGQVEVHEEG